MPATFEAEVLHVINLDSGPSSWYKSNGHQNMQPRHVQLKEHALSNETGCIYQVDGKKKAGIGTLAEVAAASKQPRDIELVA